MMDSELIAAFCSITGADSDVATHMLEASGGDVEAAVNLFFTSGATGFPSSPTETDEQLAQRLSRWGVRPR